MISYRVFKSKDGKQTITKKDLDNLIQEAIKPILDNYEVTIESVEKASDLPKNHGVDYNGYLSPYGLYLNTH